MAENKSADEIRGAQALESLLEALAAWPDLGSSAHLSVEQWNSLTAYEVKAHYDERISAVHSVDGGRVVSDHVHALGRLRYAPAVPTLIGLWEACPVRPVAVAAAHALLEIGTVEARDALRKGIHHHDRLGRLMALKVMFSDEGEAWDNVSHLFAGECLAAPAGQIAAAHALGLLAPRGHSRSGPFWSSDELRDLPSRDPRRLDLCISLRDRELLGRSARRVLRYADPAVTGPALDAARAARARQVRPRRSADAGG